MRNKDALQRFLIESADVRGSLVSLDAAWAAARGRVEYPAIIQQVLGQAFAASVLLSTTIKFEGKMTLQIRSDGPVHLLVIQVTAEQQMRGLARWTELPAEDSLQAMFGHDARMTITIEASKNGEPYQGIVALRGDSLGDALRDYFRDSEQLPTELILSVNDDVAAGLLLQKLPASGNLGDGMNPADKEIGSDFEYLPAADTDAWNLTRVLAQTVSDTEMLTLSAEQLLHKLYHEEQVRLFAAEAVAFRCSCSKERTDGLIQGLGLAEAQDILKEQGDISITCEFCDQLYVYDKNHVAQLFSDGLEVPEIKGPTLH